MYGECRISAWGGVGYSYDFLADFVIIAKQVRIFGMQTLSWPLY